MIKTSGKSSHTTPPTFDMLSQTSKVRNKRMSITDFMNISQTDRVQGRLHLAKNQLKKGKDILFIGNVKQTSPEHERAQRYVVTGFDREGHEP